MSRPIQGGAILEVANIGNVNNQRLMNVWHFRWVGAASPVENGDEIVNILKPKLQGGLVDGLLDNLRAMCNEIVNWEGIRYQWIWPVRYSPQFFADDAGPGEVVDAALPQNVCGVVTLQSIFAGPGSTGRKHFGGLSQSDETAGMMTNQFLLNAGLVVEVMNDTISTAAVQPASELVPVVFDRTNPAISVPWSEYTTRTTSRVMRRRTVGVGI